MSTNSDDAPNNDNIISQSNDIGALDSNLESLQIDFDDLSLGDSKSAVDVSDNRCHLGQLVVRIVSGRGLQKRREGHLLSTQISKTRRRIFHRVKSKTFACVSFGEKSLKTSSVEGDTSNPSWTKSEPSLLFDVHVDIQTPTKRKLNNSRSSVEKKNMEFQLDDDETDTLDLNFSPMPRMKNPNVTIILFHSSENSHNIDKARNISSPPTKINTSQFGDELVGTASLDVTQVITGKVSILDKWLPLKYGDDGEVTGNVRVIVEYDLNENNIRVGDKVQLHGFVDLLSCPMPSSQIYHVDQLVGDEAILSYITKVENWKCVIQVHKNMIVAVEKRLNPVERCSKEIVSLATNISHSPAVDVVTETIQKLPQEGIVTVGMQAAMGGLSLLDRWSKLGIQTALNDFVYATNLDGEATPEDLDDTILTGDEHESISLCSTEGELSSHLSREIPLCPLSIKPMHRPVIAADGITYERSAIRRWLRSSSISPITGEKFQHENLVPNYNLIASVRDGNVYEESDQKLLI